jgi:uncharacterized protein Yka (UPF0111/DUF47 family)
VRLRLTPQDTSFYELFTQSAANLVVGCELMAKLVAAPTEERAALGAQIRDCEHAGDDVTHRIYRQLNSTFVTPFDREDIYRLASRLDDVMDFVEAAAMPRLRGLKNLEEYWIEANRLENEADQIHRKLVARLFSGEYDALTVLKLKELVDELEQAADAFEHVADTIETIVVKES